MNWEAIGAIGEIVGAIAVVITLLYLSKQIVHSNLSARAQTRAATMQMAQNELHLVVQDPSLCAAWTKPELSFEDRVKLNYWLVACLKQRESEWISHRDGIIDDETFQAYSGVTTVVLGTERTRRWWEVQKDHGAMDPGFVRFVDKMLESAPLTTFYDNIDKW
jgi:hypothetical protein